MKLITHLLTFAAGMVAAIVGLVIYDQVERERQYSGVMRWPW